MTILNIDVNALRQPIIDCAMSSGLFAKVSGHEPKNAPGSDLSLAVWVSNLRPFRQGSGLAATAGVLVFNVRIMTSMTAEPQDDIDVQIINGMQYIMGTLSGEFTFGGNVRNLDLGGESGFLFEARAGYVNIDSRLLRILDITVPLIINDVWIEAP